MKRISINIKWFLSGLMLASLIAVAFSLVGLRSKIISITVRAESGSSWFIAELERDIKEFELSIAKYQLGHETQKNVNLYFDLLWSRAYGVGQGEIAVELRKFGIDTSPIESLIGLLEKYENTVVNVSENTPDVNEKLLSEFGALNDELHKLSLEVLQAASAETSRWREELLKISEKNVLIGIIISAAALILMILLWLDSRNAKREINEKNILLYQAKAADQARTQFISIVNHEIRTPLTSIKGALSLMNAGVLGKIPENFKKPINIAERNCTKLIKIISELLDFEKSSSGNMEYHLDKIDFREFLQEQIELNRPFADTFRVGLIAESNMPNLIVNGDSQRIGQVISNLLSNAAKFSKAGDDVIIDLKKVGDRAVVSVRDSGKGIPESARERIFERFQQVDSSNERERGGTGLGLAIVKSIIEGHGGTVVYDSVMGQGTTFRFDLPLAT